MALLEALLGVFEIGDLVSNKKKTGMARAARFMGFVFIGILLLVVGVAIYATLT